MLLVGTNGGPGLSILVDGQSTSLVKRLAMIANMIDIQIFVSEDTDVCTCPLICRSNIQSSLVHDDAVCPKQWNRKTKAASSPNSQNAAQSSLLSACSRWYLLQLVPLFLGEDRNEMYISPFSVSPMWLKSQTIFPLSESFITWVQLTWTFAVCPWSSLMPNGALRHPELSSLQF